MCETKKIVEELRNKKSRDNRELLDRSANMIEKLAKELCEKSGCHHKCHDTKDCVVEDEAREYLHSALTNEDKVSAKDKLLLINENKSNNFDVKSNNELFKQALVEGVNNHIDKTIEEEKQIEEMANILKDYTKKNHIMASSVILEDYAEALYNAGYRKQSEGEWIDKPTGAYGRMQSWCSACGKHSGIGGIESNRHKPFCPNCGAKMKGGE